MILLRTVSILTPTLKGCLRTDRITLSGCIALVVSIILERLALPETLPSQEWVQVFYSSTQQLSLKILLPFWMVFNRTEK